MSAVREFIYKPGDDEVLAALDVRRKAATRVRMEAAAICMRAPGFVRSWPEDYADAGERLRLASIHEAVAQCLAEWLANPDLISRCAAVAQTQIGSGLASDMARVMNRAYYDVDGHLGVPSLAAMMDALRDLGIAVDASWPAGLRP